MQKRVRFRALAAPLETLESRLVMSAGVVGGDVSVTLASVSALEEPVVTRPPAPTGLNATLVAPRAVVVEWNDVAGETGYVIERRIDGTPEAWARIGDTAANVTRFAQDGLAPGKTYLYRVRAVNAGVVSEPSNVDFVTVTGESTTPAAPRLEVGVIGPRAARLNWTNVAGETGYRVERRVDGSASEWRLIRTVDAGVTTITDDGLEPGNTYLYRVRAFNASGNSAYSNVGVARIAPAGLPTAPRELRGTATSPGRVELRWVDSTGETGYRIERRVDGADGWTRIGTAPANATRFVDETVSAGKTYIYRVRAFNGAGDSPNSNSAVVKVPGEADAPATPRLEVGLVGPRAARLNWTDVAGETGYRVERRVDGSADEWRVIRTAGAGVTTIVDDGLAAGKFYLYRVRAFNGAGNSGYSNVGVVRTGGEITRLATPRELRATAASPTRIDLRWGGVDGETGYRIERRLDGTDAWEKVGLAGANVTTFADTRVLPGRTYHYRVRAVGPGEPSAWSNIASAKTPEAPTTIAAVIFSTQPIAPLSL